VGLPPRSHKVGPGPRLYTWPRDDALSAEGTTLGYENRAPCPRGFHTLFDMLARIICQISLFDSDDEPTCCGWLSEDALLDV
jgi:hypothetical protein